MLWYRRWTIAALILLSAASSVAGDGYVIGIGAEGDTSDSLAFSAFGDFGITDNTWLSATAARAQAKGALSELNTIYGDVGLDHHFDPLGVRIGAAYWGDKDILDSVDIRGSIYVRTKDLSISAEYENRSFDFLFSLEPLVERRQVEFGADGYGLRFRVQTSDRASLHLRGM